ILETKQPILHQMKKAKEAKPPTSPLMLQLLIPKGMAQSTFQLPVVDAGTREFLPLEEEVNKRLSKQIDWAPPGSEPLTRGVRPLKTRLFAMRAKGDGNCLPHAVSLSLWGHGDDTLVSGVFIEMCGEGTGN
ncbi:unnamed protein product, partial [Ectocarpus sp. 12 AP-2014]